MYKGSQSQLPKMGRHQYCLTLLILARVAYAPLRVAELEMLKAFYNVTNGAEWTNNENWDLEALNQCGQVDNSIGEGWPYIAPEVPLSGSPACIYKDPCDFRTKWYGVGCTDPCFAPTDGDNCAFGRITYLNLADNNLQGTIPENFFAELINITELDLSFNALSGSIPTQTGLLRNLRAISLSHNQLTGSIPTEIAQIGVALSYSAMANAYSPGTTHFDVSNNNLTGIVPSQIGYLENLQLFDVSDNPNLGFLGESTFANLNLNPGLPAEIGLLTNLKVLKLDRCGFSGTIPPSIGELSQLEHFLARGTTAGLRAVTNRFSGTIPTQIGKLNQLIHFALNDNRISGTIPPEIGNMYMLTRFELQENSLSGTMPDAFGGLPKLTWWDTFGNMMIGDLPDSMQNITATLDTLYIQTEHTDVLRRFRCRERIPGFGNINNDMQVPSRQAGSKVNWYIQVAEYFNYKYVSACVDPFDAETAFHVLSGDV